MNQLQNRTSMLRLQPRRETPLLLPNLPFKKSPGRAQAGGERMDAGVFTGVFFLFSLGGVIGDLFDTESICLNPLFFWARGAIIFSHIQTVPFALPAR